jgi:hypothetical protein
MLKTNGATQMQTLVVEIATTFHDDATHLIRGFARMIVQTLMAPIDRLAIACDVTGVLDRHVTTKPGFARMLHPSPRQDLSPRQGPRRGCIFSLRCLSHLT